MKPINKPLTILFALCSIFIIRSVYAEIRNATENFLYANELYKQKNYKDAIKSYDLIINKSPQVFYNMGNCAYKLGKKGQAIALWRKAEHNWGLSSREELLNNIALAKKDLLVENEKQSTGIKKFIRLLSQQVLSFVKAIPLLWFQLILLLIWLLLFLYLRYLHIKKRRLILITLFGLLFYTASLLVLKYSLLMINYGVVINKETIMRAGPGDTYKTLGTINEGEEIKIQKESDNFYKISHKKSIGWVTQQDIKPI